MSYRMILLGSLILAANLWGQNPTEEKKAPLPRILLLGDSIRLGYAPVVTKKLQGKAEIISYAPNGGDTNNMLKNLDKWLQDAKPNIVHINCGLHDLKYDDKKMQHQVPLEEYRKNLHEIITRIQKVTPQVYFALTTPIIDDRHAQRKAGFSRKEADVQKYNEVAMAVMKERNIPVNDLHAVVKQTKEEIFNKDGTHYLPNGNDILATAVVGTLMPKK